MPLVLTNRPYGSLPMTISFAIVVPFVFQTAFEGSFGWLYETTGNDNDY